MNQFDMAEHMFKKSLACKELFDPNTTESLADILFEIGKGLLYSKQYHMAVKWLERAFDIINGPEIDQLSVDAGELRISVMEATIKALLGLKEAAAAEKARDLVHLLEENIGDKLLVLLLKLELLSASTNESFDSVSYRDNIHKIITSIVLTESTFKLIMLHIRKLNDKSPNLACSHTGRFPATTFIELGVRASQLD